MFYSPEDQLLEEQSRLACAKSNIHNTELQQDASSTDTEPKRIRLSYEGEPDTTKWAIPPAPDIFSGQHSTTDNNLHNRDHPAEGAEASSQPEDQMFASFKQTDDSSSFDTTDFAANLHLSTEVMNRVEALCAAQNDFERRLYEHRKRIQHGHSVALQHLEAREIIAPVPSHEKEAVLRQHAMELERADKRAVSKLDELRYQQQMELQKLGVPGFYPSSNPAILKLQQDALKHLLNKRSS
ncbi:hypothetical protein IW138_002007 [Coemansia sp. RSA 986]|nr:hypothetical protein IW138_002007 [Coemansia sp. RSA 986]